CVSVTESLPGDEMTKLHSGRFNFWLSLIFTAIAFALGFLGWHLENAAFAQPPSAGQAYAAVFVRDPAARVNLKADIYPDAPWSDKLTITVGATSKKKAGWVLIIECPVSTRSLPQAVNLYSETAPQTQSPSGLVSVYYGVTSRQS